MLIQSPAFADDTDRAFLIQVPPTVAAISMVAISLKLPVPQSSTASQSTWSRLKRIDFTGAIFLSTAILCLCMVLDLGGSRIPWTSHWIFILLGSALASTIVFVISSKHAPEPIFPLRLVSHSAVVTTYLVIFFQTTAQNALMVIVPIYFQATAAATTSQAGAHLIPAFAGNTLGGLCAGYFIKRSGRFKSLTILSPIIGVLCMVVLLLTWNGNTSPWLSLLIFPGGVAMGILSSSAFVSLAAGVEEQDFAVTTSGMFLAFNFGMISGVSGGSAVFQDMLRGSLERAVRGVAGGEEVRGRLSIFVDFADGCIDYATCSCGYRLHANGRECHPPNAYPGICGSLPLRQRYVLLSDETSRNLF